MNYAGGRVVLALEGGYNLDTISDSAEECVKVASHCTCLKGTVVHSSLVFKFIKYKLLSHSLLPVDIFI